MEQYLSLYDLTLCAYENDVYFKKGCCAARYDINMVVDAPFYAQTTACFAASLSSGQWKCTQTLFRENVTKYSVKRVSEIIIEAVALQTCIVSEKCRPEGKGRISLILRVPWAWTCSFNYKFPNKLSHTPKNKTTAFLYTWRFCGNCYILFSRVYSPVCFLTLYSICQR